MNNLTQRIDEIIKQANFIFISNGTSREELLEIIETRLDFFNDIREEVIKALQSQKEKFEEILDNELIRASLKINANINHQKSRDLIYNELQLIYNNIKKALSSQSPQNERHTDAKVKDTLSLQTEDKTPSSTSTERVNSKGSHEEDRGSNICENCGGKHQVIINGWNVDNNGCQKFTPTKTGKVKE